MSKKNSVEIVISDLNQHPYCLHGPTLLFKSEKNCFYACSSCRNKECNFHMPEDKWSKQKVKQSNKKYISLQQHVDSSFIYQNFIKVFQAPAEKRIYCYKCNVLDLESSQHKGHELLKKVTDSMLLHPTNWLPPLDNDSKEAQYYFNTESVSVIINALRKNNIRHIICLGTPRIHEFIETSKSKELTSILLDIDKRHYNFQPPNKFLHYNMFNNYFFNGREAESLFKQFLSSVRDEKCCIVMDPPFGGRTEPLAHTLRMLSKLITNINHSKSLLIGEVVPAIWVFPYFSEAYIRNELPEFEMSDYQVKYDNHKNFGEKKRGVKDSPVRIFTNMALGSIDLSRSEGYAHCVECDRWVGDWNKHCSECGGCASKNGQTYWHCGRCGKCVKPKFVHCETCERCALPNHECGLKLPKKRCFHCDQYGHKRAHCPQRSKTNSDDIATVPRKRRCVVELIM